MRHDLRGSSTRHLFRAAPIAGLLLAAACAPSAQQGSANSPAGPQAPSSVPLPATPQVSQTPVYPLIPYPRNLTPGTGTFVLDSLTRIVVPESSTEIEQTADRWAQRVRVASGLPLSVVRGGATERALLLRIDPAAGYGSPEGYTLSVTPSGTVLAAPAPAGLFYGLQTIRQLLPVAVERGGLLRNDTIAWAIPAVQIEDAPRFSYRGLHLDVGRHFMPVDFIKKYIDLIALQKMNRFHWHLTEDQGWRLEIKQYPRLTKVGGYREGTLIGHYGNQPHQFDNERYGGFYTQDEVRDLVEYARERYVTIIPEIELPGHSLAALSAYPELGCTEGPFKAAMLWGVFEDIFCPKEETFTFLENVLTEVMQLFPSEYIHIGGDEAPKKRWEESAFAQEVMRREGLKDEHELQSYFIQRIEKFLNAHGRKLIGWDEILEGGLAPNATVMSWRGTAGGIAAAQQGHDVVMTPNDDLYFDHYQGDPATEPVAIGGLTTLRDVYAYEPIPEELTPEQAKHILGAQGNVWTEYMKTPEKVEYMVFPRALALSEVVWSPREEREWNGFAERLRAYLERLDVLLVNYRMPEL